MTHIEHAQLGFAGPLLPRTCAGRFAVVFPGFSIPFPSTSQAVIAVTCFLPRCHIRVETTTEKIQTLNSVLIGDIFSSNRVEKWNLE